MINAKPLEIQHPPRPELRLDRPRDVDGGLDAERRHAGFEDGEVDGDDAGHFDGAAKGDFAVSLGEVEVADGELGAGDVDGEVDFGALGGWLVWDGKGKEGGGVPGRGS